MNEKTPSWMRAFDIIGGLIAIALSIGVLAYQDLAILTLTVILAVALLFIGFARVAFGIVVKIAPGWLRAISAGVGFLAIISAIVAAAYPELAVETLIILLAFALLVHGFMRIAVGGFAKIFPNWVRGLLVGIGLLTLVLGVVVIAVPSLGLLTLVLLLAVTLLLNGIESIVSGVKGTI